MDLLRKLLAMLKRMNQAAEQRGGQPSPRPAPAARPADPYEDFLKNSRSSLPARAEAPAPATSGFDEVTIEFDPEPDLVSKQRQVLIEACMSVVDNHRDRNEALFAQMTDALRDAGLEVVDPLGQPLDRSDHEVRYRDKTADRALDGTVSRTLLLGYRDGDRWLRKPAVAVYDYEGEPSDGR